MKLKVEFQLLWITMDSGSKLYSNFLKIEFFLNSIILHQNKKCKVAQTFSKESVVAGMPVLTTDADLAIPMNGIIKWLIRKRKSKYANLVWSAQCLIAASFILTNGPPNLPESMQVD